jgi:ribose transport system permease protein
VSPMERTGAEAPRQLLPEALATNFVTVLLFVVVVLMFLVGELLAPGFLALSHVGLILRTASFLGIVAIGQTLVILTGGIDLSVGPVITMGNVFICMFMSGQNSNNLWSFGVILLLGLAFGAVSGLGISFLRISPLVMTLAVGSLVTGFTLIFSHGAPKGLASPFLRQVGVGNAFGPVPWVVLVWASLSAVVVVLLLRSVFGRKLYYTGANEKAAMLSGVHVRRVKVTAYALSGATAILCGALMAGYTRTAFLGIGDEYTMWSIAAVVIGGSSLAGGKGGYVGTIAGAIILALLESLLTVMNIPEAGRRIARGMIILIMIAIYFRKRSRT